MWFASRPEVPINSVVGKDASRDCSLSIRRKRNVRRKIDVDNECTSAGWIELAAARSADCKTKPRTLAARIPRPLSESFINTSSPSLTSPLTRFTQAMGNWRDTARIAVIRPTASRTADLYTVIVVVVVIVVRSPLKRSTFWPGPAWAPPWLSRRNDLVHGLNSRSHTLLDTTIQERSPNTLRSTRTDVVNCTSFSSSR